MNKELEILLDERVIHRQWLLFLQGMDAFFEANTLHVDPVECFQKTLTKNFSAHGKRVSPNGAEGFIESMRKAAFTFVQWKHFSSNERIEFINANTAILTAYVSIHHLIKPHGEGGPLHHDSYTSTSRATFVRSTDGWRMERLDRSKDDWGLGEQYPFPLSLSSPPQHRDLFSFPPTTQSTPATAAVGFLPVLPRQPSESWTFCSQGQA